MNLYENLISVIKESQIKLGYESMPLSINYIQSSLNNLFGCEVDDRVLDDFCDNCDTLGELTYQKIDNGYRIDIPSKGVDYVHSIIDEGEFLVKFIATIRRFDCTLDDVIALFKSFGDDVVVQQVDNDEFDYLIYFESGQPDEFYYCIDTEDLGMTYHRFTKKDYIDFNF